MSQQELSESEIKLTFKFKLNEERTPANGANLTEYNKAFCEEIRPPTVGQEFKKR